MIPFRRGKKNIKGFSPYQGVVWDKLLAEGQLARSALYVVSQEGKTRERGAANVSAWSRLSSLYPGGDDIGVG